VPASEQGIERDQYTLVPRTIVFVRRGSSYLLIRGSGSKKRWAGKYNGIGGHITRGEDVLTSARRELLEETSLDVDLWLCGLVVVDAGEVGVGLFVLCGEADEATPRPSVEGTPDWIPMKRMSSIPAVEDLLPLLTRIDRMHRGDPPFSARSAYDEKGCLRLEFAN
jgi:8-oxo-dGTP diphosphatase